MRSQSTPSTTSHLSRGRRGRVLSAPGSDRHAQEAIGPRSKTIIVFAPPLPLFWIRDSSSQNFHLRWSRPFDTPGDLRMRAAYSSTASARSKNASGIVSPLRIRRRPLFAVGSDLLSAERMITHNNVQLAPCAYDAKLPLGPHDPPPWTGPQSRSCWRVRRRGELFTLRLCRRRANPVTVMRALAGKQPLKISLTPLAPIEAFQFLWTSPSPEAIIIANREVESRLQDHGNDLLRRDLLPGKRRGPPRSHRRRFRERGRLKPS
jgi:hypothetical protein